MTIKSTPKLPNISIFPSYFSLLSLFLAASLTSYMSFRNIQNNLSLQYVNSKSPALQREAEPQEKVIESYYIQVQVNVKKRLFII